VEAECVGLKYGSDAARDTWMLDVLTRTENNRYYPRSSHKIIIELQEDCLMASDVDEIMTIEELSSYLKVSRSTTYKLAQQGVLPGTKVGKHWRFHKDAVDEWLKKRSKHPSRKKT
jgi:excisionase family DNA binding protein